MVIPGLLLQFISLSPASTVSMSLVSVWGSIQFSSVTQSCLTLCDPMDCSTPGPPVHHQCPKFAQIHVHQVSESVMPSNHLIQQWCHPTISSSVVPFFSCLQSFPDSGSFLMCQLLVSDGQSIGVSASASVLPMNIQDWFLLWLTLDLLAVQGTLKSLLQHHSSKTSTLWHSAFFMVLLSHHTWLLEKP